MIPPGLTQQQQLQWLQNHQFKQQVNYLSHFQPNLLARLLIISFIFQLLLQQGHQQNVVRTPILTTVKGNIVQQIPVQQQQQLQAGQQVQQQQQGQQTVMHSPSQQLINTAILPSASGGGSVTVWQRRPDQSW